MAGTTTDPDYNVMYDNIQTVDFMNFVTKGTTRLESLRKQCARLAHELGERELTGRVLRGTLETELYSGNKAEAEKRAKADPRYLDHERNSLQVAHDLADAQAEAEGLALKLKAAIAAESSYAQA